jgi:AbrB family looped-hinge helix DNA binding protein
METGSKRRVDAQGRVVIPLTMREMLRWGDGTLVEFHVVGSDTLALRAVVESPSACALCQHPIGVHDLIIIRGQSVCEACAGAVAQALAATGRTPPAVVDAGSEG